MTSVRTRGLPTELVGTLTFVATSDALVGCHFERETHKLDTCNEAGGDADLAEASRADIILDQARNWLGRYLAGERPDPSELPLAPRGTAFQLATWKELLRIPYGRTCTYGQIARALERHLGRRVSARAVGQAVGRNPIAVIVPCHRVMGASGRLTGFGGGINAKIALLDHEGIEVAGFVRPQPTNERTS